MSRDLAPKAIDFPDESGTPAPELRATAIKMLQALASWRAAVKGSPDELMWMSRISDVEKKARNVSAIMTDELVFPGKSQQAAYLDSIRSYLSLSDDLMFSADTLPRPDMLENAASFIDSLVDLPSQVIKNLGDSLTKIGAATGEGVGATLRATFGALLSNIWPLLIVGGVVLVVYEIGPDKILKKVGAK